jgi:hypothetical protein
MFIEQCLMPSSLPVIRAPADFAVVRVLSVLVEQVGIAVEALDQPGAHRRFFPQPDRAADDEDVGGLNLVVQRRPAVARRAVLGHVRIDTGGEIEIDRADEVDLDAVRLHDRHRELGEALGVRALG